MLFASVPMVRSRVPVTTRHYAVFTTLMHRRIDRVSWRWCASPFLPSPVYLVWLTTGVTDGMVIIWTQSNSPSQTAYGSDLSADDMQFEKEHWKPRTTFRCAPLTAHLVVRGLTDLCSCTTMQVYDLAWSPTGEYIISGSTDNVARIFLVSEGNRIHLS